MQRSQSSAGLLVWRVPKKFRVDVVRSIARDHLVALVSFVVLIAFEQPQLSHAPAKDQAENNCELDESEKG